MFHTKRKNGTIRKGIQTVQAGLVVAAGLFGLALLDQAWRSETPVPDAPVAIVTVPVVRQQPELPRLNSAMDYYNIALDLSHNDLYETAVPYYNEAIRLDPSYAWSWLGRGISFEYIGDSQGSMSRDFYQFMQLYVRESHNNYLNEIQTVRGHLDTLAMTDGRVYVFIFEAEAGDLLEVSASSALTGAPYTPGVVDPLLVLLNADGQPVAANDDAFRSDGAFVDMNAHLRYGILRDGTYTVLLGHAGGGAEGMMEISLTLR